MYPKNNFIYLCQLNSSTMKNNLILTLKCILQKPSKQRSLILKSLSQIV
jgi:hypothetical protein